MSIRPVDIARKLGISTTTLRTYEELGLIPPVKRTASGYRVYTEEHVAYLVCVREMLGGFTLKQISEILKQVMEKDIDAALWLATKAQADLYAEKNISEKIIRNLRSSDEHNTNRIQKLLTINEISHETGVPVTTIRYWDKVGLITAERSLENNYRKFTEEHLRQILTIYALKFSVSANRQKHSLERIRKDLDSFSYNDESRIATMVSDIGQYLNRINRAKIKGISALYKLCAQTAANCL